MKPSGPNWKILQKLSLVAFFGLLCWSLLPWAECAFVHMDATPIANVDDAHGHGLGDSPDEQRAERAERFLGGFFGSIGACYRANPVGADYPWQWPAIGGALLAAIAFQRLDRFQYARRIRRSANHHAAYGYSDPKVRPTTGAPKKARSIDLPSGDYVETPATTSKRPLPRVDSRDVPDLVDPLAERASGPRPAAMKRFGSGDRLALDLPEDDDRAPNDEEPNESGPDWEWD